MWFIPGWSFYIVILSVGPILCWIHYRCRNVNEDDISAPLTKDERYAGWVIRYRLAVVYFVSVTFSIFYGIFASWGLDERFFGSRCVGRECHDWRVAFIIELMFRFPFQMHIFWMMYCYSNRLLPVEGEPFVAPVIAV